MNYLFEKIEKLNIKFSDREVAQISVIFVIAYMADLIVADIRNIPSSLKSIFVIWYTLLALKFPKIYLASLFLAIISFILAFIINFYHNIAAVDNFLQVGFFLAIIGFIQIIILERRNLKNHD